MLGSPCVVRWHWRRKREVAPGVSLNVSDAALRVLPICPCHPYFHLKCWVVFFAKMCSAMQFTNWFQNSFCWSTFLQILTSDTPKNQSQAELDTIMQKNVQEVYWKHLASELCSAFLHRKQPIHLLLMKRTDLWLWILVGKLSPFKHTSCFLLVYVVRIYTLWHWLVERGPCSLENRADEQRRNRWRPVGLGWCCVPHRSCYSSGTAQTAHRMVLGHHYSSTSKCQAMEGNLRERKSVTFHLQQRLFLPNDTVVNCEI